MRLMGVWKTFFAIVLATVSPLLCVGQATIHVPADVGTIQGAIDAAQNGDTVLVSPGLYNEDIDFKGKAITITTGAKSYNDAASTILNGTHKGAVVTFQSGEPSNTVLNGFTIQNGLEKSGSPICAGIVITGASPSLSNNVIQSNTGCGVFIASSASPLLQGNHLTQNQGSAVYISQASDIQILNNIIEDNATGTVSTSGAAQDAGAGILVVGAHSLLLKANLVRHNLAANTSGFDVASPVQSLTLVDNLFYDNNSRFPGTDQISIFGPGAGMGQPTSLIEINNTIYGQGEELALFFASSSTIANNIFVNDSQFNSGFPPQSSGLACVDAMAQNSPITILNNDIFNTGSLQDGGCALGAGNISRDPLLRNPSGGDYHEQFSSPTVAAGDITAPMIPLADLDLKARTVCGTIDMGAYELRPHPPITLTSSLNPAPGGSALIFTATLTGNCNEPTGLISFLDGDQVIGTSLLNASAIATLSTALLVVGQHDLTATYPGDFNFDDSTSGVLVQTITGDPTATSLSVSPNPAFAFSPVTVQSRVTSPYGTPSGSVNFLSGGSVIATAPLGANGSAVATVSSLGAGTYSITALYTADTRFQPSTSAVVQEKVISASTSTMLTASPNPAAVTQLVTFSAVVRAAQGSSHIPSGTVTFEDGTVILGVAPVNASGIATFSTNSLSFGSHVITAQYDGSPDFNPSSGTITESVTLIATSLTLTASPNPANSGQTVTLTAVAASALSGVVSSGVVTFFEGSTQLGSAPLASDGVATLDISTLSVGSHPIQAKLAMSSAFGGSNSQIVNEVVQAYDFTIQLGQNSVSLPSGDWTVFPLTLSPVGGFTGRVQLSCSGLPDHAQCAFPDGDTVSLAAGAKTTRFSLNTSDVYGYGKQIGAFSPESLRSHTMLAVALPALDFLCLYSSRRKWLRSFSRLLLLIVLVTFSVLQGCSGKLPGKATPGTYLITVTGDASGSTPLVKTTTVQLTVTAE